MKKRFITRRNSKRILYEYGIYLLIIFLVWLSFKFMFKLFNQSSNEVRANEYLAISTNHLLGEINFLPSDNFNLSSPVSILRMSLSHIKELPTVIEMPVIKPLPSNEPLVYIYNTHQTEEYQAGSLREYNLTPTVFMAGSMLQSALRQAGINSILEEANMRSLLKKKGFSYNQSYEISRSWVVAAKKNYPSINYFIDLHRDSATSSVTIEDITYAKMMFVIGKNHAGYQKNEALALKIYEDIKINYPGVMKKTYYNDTSRFNQDLHQHALLIEVGGPNHQITEIYNSINILAESLAKVVNNHG